jgi:hypothetical protein
MHFYFDLPNGVYQVDLHFIETWAGLPSDYQHAVGWRVFTVQAEGLDVLKNLDVFKAVGANVPLVKSFPVTVTDGTLTLVWSHYGMVSGIAVCLPTQVVNGQCG